MADPPDEKDSRRVPSTLAEGSGYPVEEEVIAKRNPRLCRIFTSIFRRQLKRNFHAIRLLSAPPEVEGPLICFMNHPSWNDPMVISFLSDRFFPAREAYGPIDAEALKGYGFFSKIGLFGVERGSGAGARRFLRTCLAILDRTGTVIWITAQGRFADVRERPVALEPGLGAVLKKYGSPVTALPVAVEYSFGEEKFPEVFVTFGEPVAAPDGDWNTACQLALENVQDQLAEKVIAKNPDEFQTLLGGNAGVGGIYGLWQRFKALVRGEKFDPGHGSLTS